MGNMFLGSFVSVSFSKLQSLKSCSDIARETTPDSLSSLLSCWLEDTVKSHDKVILPGTTLGTAIARVRARNLNRVSPTRSVS